jgi:hypothetical protein
VLTRRRFLTTAALGTLGAGLPRPVIPAERRDSRFFTVHPFVERHPEAVFIMPTTVGDKMDEAAKRETGLAFGRSVLLPSVEGGIPSNITIPVKMNLKTTGAGAFPIEEIIGTVADFHFGEGLFGSLAELGVRPANIRLRENPRGDSFRIYGIVDMADRAGIDFREDIPGTVFEGMEEGRDFSWRTIPEGGWFSKIPQLEPINDPITWLLNISKFKTHGMGLTLCSKNLQGMIARPFCRLCAPADNDMGVGGHIRPDAIDHIAREYVRHRDVNRIPRWDRPGPNGGIWQEVWTQRTLDNLSVTPCGLCVIEGIYGATATAATAGRTRSTVPASTRTSPMWERAITCRISSSSARTFSAPTLSATGSAGMNRGISLSSTSPSNGACRMPSIRGNSRCTSGRTAPRHCCRWIRSSVRRS